MSQLDAYLTALAAGDAAGLVASLREDTALRVAVHDEPFIGQDTIGFIFGHLFAGVLNDVQIRDVLADGNRRVAVFDVRVEGHEGTAEGLNLITIDSEGQLADVTVFLRPLAALQALADEMGRRLGGPRPA